MAIQLTILILCIGGLYVSFFMYRKAAAAARGELTEPSVVQTTTARALFGAPNSAFGLAYYLLLAVATPFLANPLVWMPALAAAACAGAVSLYLAYSLLFRTKRPCPYCWSAHAINWALIAALIGAKHW